jgi:uncharacterized membrane protein
MQRAIAWIWRQGIISTFLSGLFAILPVVLTVMIVTWVARYLYSLFSEGPFGTFLYSIGFRLGTKEAFASAVGWVLVLTSVWFLGLFMKATTRYHVEQALNSVMKRIPVVSSIYSTATQLVGMVRKDTGSELKAMCPVFCSFGLQPWGGILGLLTSPDIYRIGEEEYFAVYIPYAPLPMTGILFFAPAASCRRLDMTAEQVMRMYLSLGVLTPQVMPPEYLATQRQAE